MSPPVSGPVPSTSMPSTGPGVEVGGGVAGPGTRGAASPSRASRRQRGPSSAIISSSKSSHASVADGGRFEASLAVRRAIHSEISGSTPATWEAGGSGSLIWRMTIAIGFSASENGGRPVYSSYAMHPTE